MISSMTGFGQAQTENEKINLHIQIKSVNGRFLETRFRMPREYSSLEAEFKKRISAKISRGSVDVSINRTLKSEASNLEVIANLGLAKGWLNAARDLGSKLGIKAELDLNNVLRVPDVIQVAERAGVPDWEKDALINTLDKALAQCVAEKRREGDELGKILGQILERLAAFVTAVQERKSELDDELQAKLRERLKALDETVSVDPNRLSQEVLFLLDKADIAEEIARAETHLKAYRGALNEKGSVGKKLEFYTQELHREFNTMGSKTQSLDVTLDIIEAKTNVERLREQVQNIE